MFAYWPGADTEPGGPEISKSMARKMNVYKKYVISSQDEKQPLAWNNAEQVLIRGSYHNGVVGMFFQAKNIGR